MYPTHQNRKKIHSKKNHYQSQNIHLVMLQKINPLHLHKKIKDKSLDPPIIEKKSKKSSSCYALQQIHPPPPPPQKKIKNMSLKILKCFYRLTVSTIPKQKKKFTPKISLPFPNNPSCYAPNNPTQQKMEDKSLRIIKYFEY